MSRTTRRKNVHADRWVTHDRKLIRRENGPWCVGTWFWEPKSPIDLAQSLAKFHGDHGYTTTACCGRGPGVAFRQNYQRIYRRKAKQEVIKFLKNEEYEVQIQNNPYLPYWD